MLPQEQQQLLSSYQSLVVKQLVSQSQGRKQQQQVEEGEATGESSEAEERDEEAKSIRGQLVALTPQVKELVLSQRKTSVTEDWTF